MGISMDRGVWLDDRQLSGRIEWWLSLDDP